MKLSSLPAPARLMPLLLSVLFLGGCSVMQQFEARVGVRAVKPAEYAAAKRADILTSGVPSAAALEVVKVAGLDDGPCARLEAPAPACIGALAAAQGIRAERQLSALAELWAQQALLATASPDAATSHAPLEAWLETARHAYAYLFFSERQPGERAFEDRQTQVRDYYNLAVQQAAAILFRRRGAAPIEKDGITVGAWTLRSDLSHIRPAATLGPPQELIPASSLAFTGLRSLYRRDGFGAELVSAAGPRPGAHRRPGAAADKEAGQSWSEMPYPVMTALLRFEGTTLAEVLATHAVTFVAYDAYEHEEVRLHGQRVPLAANFTAGYGLWLARSGFSGQSIRVLLGREQSLQRPHLYLMQPYDPKRRVILMIHGLASSPEAWVNVANEILGDERLRREFQVWQVFYPTNMPIGLNHVGIRRAVDDAMGHFDPAQTAQASRDMVVIGHSMGGVIAHMMVSSTQGGLFQQLIDDTAMSEARRKRLRARIGPILDFEPVPAVRRAVFIAAPHGGTPVAGGRIGRWLAGTIRLPLTVLESFADVLQDDGPGNNGRNGAALRFPNGLDNLREDDRFMQAASKLPIAPQVTYHSIIARTSPEGPLELSDDGLVPYRSAHLPGAASEKIIVSGHSVQETAAGILELRRILHADLAQHGD